MPEKPRRSSRSASPPRRLADDALEAREREPASRPDLSDTESAVPDEPGVAVASTEWSVQFLRDAMEQYNFESERRPDAGSDLAGAPLGQVLSDATLEAADQAELDVPVSAALADDQPETRAEPEQRSLDLTSHTIVEASLFDVPVSDVPPEQEEQEAEDDISAIYARPLRAPEIVTDDPSDVDDQREREIQRALDERVKKRLRVSTLPHERPGDTRGTGNDRHRHCSPAAMASSTLQQRRARHAARASQTAHQAAQRVRDMTGLEDDASALAALQIVAGAIVRRVTPREAADFVAQLPSELESALLDLPAGPDKSITLDTIAVELAATLGIEPEAAARLMREVGIAIRGLVSRGEIAHVLSQLPREMRDLLPDVIPHQTP